MAGLLTLLKPAAAAKPLPPRAKEMASEIADLEGKLEQDYTRRVYGDGTYVGYMTLRDFYKGRHWSFKKDGNGTMRTYNYCFTIVENMTAFLTNEAPQMSCPADDVSDIVERALAEGRTKILNKVHDHNSLPLVFQCAVRTASRDGDAYIFGSIPTFKTDKKTGKKSFDSIRYWNQEHPENIRPIWKDDNYQEMAGFIKHYQVEESTAKTMFKEEIKESGLRVVAERPIDTITRTQLPTETPMVTIKEVWTETEYLLMIGNNNTVVSYMEHNWGFVPLWHVPNIHIPGEPRGTSDLENELDPQQEYNERASDLADIIKIIASPTYWGKNLDNLTEIRAGQSVIYEVGDEGVINAMPRSGETQPIDSYLADRKNDIVALSGMNQVLYPNTHVLQSTGRALSVIMQGVNNKIALRKDWWIRAFKGVNMSILYHAQTYIPDAKLVINDNFTTDVFISSILVRAVSDEINKFQAKIQSLTTTQQNVGIENPAEEQKLMKEELQDEVLATEIAKNPGLLHQIMAERIQQMGQGGQFPGSQAGNPSPMSPQVANEGENTPSPLPAPGTASPVSPKGAIAQRAQRAGQPPALPPKR